MRRRPVAGLSARAVRPVLAGVEALGHDTERILSRLAINRESLADDEWRLPHAAMMRLWSVAEETSGDPDIGIHAAESIDLRAFDVHAYAVLSSESFATGMRRVARYQRLIHDATMLECIEDEERVTIRHALPGGRPVPRLPAQYLMTLWVRFGRAMLGDRWRAPRAIRLAHGRPESVAEYARVFGPSLRFDAGENALVLERDVAYRSNAERDGRLVAILDAHAAHLLDTGSTATDAPFSSAVEHALQTLMDGVPSVADVAGSCHASVRTLRRRLQEEGTGYREIVDRVRHRRACAMLTGSDATVDEIAFLLGYAETRAFRAAFRRWTATTPGDYRRTGSRSA